MNLTTYLAAGGLLASALTYGLWTLDSRAKSAQIEASAVMLDMQAKDIVKAKSANDSNLATLTQIKADLARQKEVASKFETQARTRGVALSTALKRINDAPKSDDGDLAPVLKRELTGLQLVQPANPPPDGPNQDPVGDPTPPLSPNLPTPTENPGS